jgi:hypothetical protein
MGLAKTGDTKYISRSSTTNKNSIMRQKNTTTAIAINDKKIVQKNRA